MDSKASNLALDYRLGLRRRVKRPSNQITKDEREERLSRFSKEIFKQLTPTNATSSPPGIDPEKERNIKAEYDRRIREARRRHDEAMTALGQQGRMAILQEMFLAI